MPTNFHVSTQPALRGVTGEPYQVLLPNPSAGFFSRLRVAERLVIQHGPQQTFGNNDRAWMTPRAHLILPTGFAKKTSHA